MEDSNLLNTWYEFCFLNCYTVFLNKEASCQNDADGKELKKMKFNEHLKSLIEKSGFTNAELARRIGVHKSYITQLINRHCNPPSKQRCSQIADVLGCKEQERTELLFSAIEGRMRDDVLDRPHAAHLSA